MRHSQSHLISLAVLLQNAEARHSAMPPPAMTEEGGSGLIDIVAMQKQAQEEREAADAAATRTPVPTVTSVASVSTVRSAETDPDLVAALAASRRQKRLALGVVGGALVLVAVAIGFRSSRAASSAPDAAQAAQAAIVQTSPPPVAAPPPAPVVAAPVAPVPAVAAPVAASEPPVVAKRKKKSRKGSHAKAKGPKMVKVTSSGVAN